MSGKRPDLARHYRVRHQWTYTYPDVVHSSYGRATLLPRDGHGQRVHEATLAVTPEPAEVDEHRDIHGNPISYFHVTREHRGLEVVAESLVSVMRRAPDPVGVPHVSWELTVAAVAAMRATGQGAQGEGPTSVLTVTESALPSELAAPDDTVLEYAMASFRPGTPLVAAALDLARRIATDHAYHPGAPTGRPAVTLGRRTGGSADLAHLMAAGLRSMGLAARYVSGYVTGAAAPAGPDLDENGPDDPSGMADLEDDDETSSHRGVGTMHAWVGVWVPGGGWIHVDPANARFVDGRYVTLAWGRDLGDVSPLQGIVYTPGAGSTLSTDLTIERVSLGEVRRSRATTADPSARTPASADT